MVSWVYSSRMRLHGSTEGNLIAAIQSARRWRGLPVYADTLRHWTDILHHAEVELAAGARLPCEPLNQLVAQLKVELAERR